jgi:hypothetical protein
MKPLNLATAALVATIVAASCSAPTRRVTFQTGNIVEPNAFGRNLFHIAEAGTASDWGTQLTAERRAMGETYVDKHFKAWRPILLELQQTFGGTADSTEFRVNGTALEFNFDRKWTLLLRVTTEEGALKINQD